MEDDSLISDSEYDSLARMIRPELSTGNDTLDQFFREKFVSCTGMWIYDHPEIDKIKALYEKYYKRT